MRAVLTGKLIATGGHIWKIEQDQTTQWRTQDTWERMQAQTKI